jgi:hypothetical protein
LVVLVGLIELIVVLDAVPAALVLSIGLIVLSRRRAVLGRPATIAITGAAVLLAVAAVNVAWVPRSVDPVGSDLLNVLTAVEPADLMIMLVVSVAYPAASRCS